MNASNFPDKNNDEEQKSSGLSLPSASQPLVEQWPSSNRLPRLIQLLEQHRGGETVPILSDTHIGLIRSPQRAACLIRAPQYSYQEFVSQTPAITSVAGYPDVRYYPTETRAASAVSSTPPTSRRRERWTQEEHDSFLIGLERHGRKWKKIQAYVQSKTPVQVRTHAYGYFAKLLRNMPEHICVWDANGTLTAIKSVDDSELTENTDLDRRGLEILQKHVLNKRRKPETTTEGDESPYFAPRRRAQSSEHIHQNLGQPSSPDVSAPSGEKSTP